MFGDEGGFVGGELSEFRKVFFGACVTDGNTGIPDEWFEFDSLDRGLCEDTSEVFESHIKKVREGVGEYFFTCVKRSFAGDLGETIPRAGVETVIAAVDAIADRSAEFLGDRTFMLNGEIRDAAGGGKFSRSGDCLGGAGTDTGCAFTAVIGGFRVRNEIEGG